MKLAKQNIEDFHKLQKQNGYLLQKEKGIYLGQRVLSLEAVGISFQEDVPNIQAAF